MRLDAVDGRNPASPMKSFNDDSPVNSNTIVSRGFKVEQDFVHPRYLHPVEDLFLKVDEWTSHVIETIPRSLSGCEAT